MGIVLLTSNTVSAVCWWNEANLTLYLVGIDSQGGRIAPAIASSCVSRARLYLTSGARLLLLVGPAVGTIIISSIMRDRKGARVLRMRKRARRRRSKKSIRRRSCCWSRWMDQQRPAGRADGWMDGGMKFGCSLFATDIIWPIHHT